jgi:hypothetical protein
MSQFKEIISELSSIMAPSQHSAVDEATKESRIVQGSSFKNKRCTDIPINLRTGIKFD